MKEEDACDDGMNGHDVHVFSHIEFDGVDNSWRRLIYDFTFDRTTIFNKQM